LGMDKSSPKATVTLPEKYYLDYFQDLVSFIQEYSAHLIGPDEQIFLNEFSQLSENAKCLYIRFSNRKGIHFRSDKLDYQEIEIPDAIDELHITGFITDVVNADDGILRLFTKHELVKTYSFLELPKSIKKTELYEELIAHQDYTPLLKTFPVIEINFQETVEYLKMLFFGYYHAQMTEFVIRDVGHVQLEDLSKHQFKPWFDTIEEAKNTFEISQIYSEAKRALRLFPAALLHDTFQDVDFDRYTQFLTSRKISDKLILRLAQQLEREKEPELALNYYRKGTAHPCRERQIRILDKQKQTDKAIKIAQSILKQSRNASELLFAKDYLERPKVKILRSTTKKIKESHAIIEVTPSKGINVESLALAHFEQKGYQGIHGENYLWNNLFGLTLWNELLDSHYDSYHHPLQRTASDIHKEDFFTNRQTQFEKRLKLLRTRKIWIDEIKKIINHKKGISNRFVYWHTDVEHHMELLLQHLPLKGAKAVIMEMAKNLKENSKGFPDLFIWNQKSYHFYEVKSPNDQLSAQQLFWMEFFQQNKIKSEVLKLVYPQQ
jgi:hypothetical protein